MSKLDSLQDLEKKRLITSGEAAKLRGCVVTTILKSVVWRKHHRSYTRQYIISENGGHTIVPDGEALMLDTQIEAVREYLATEAKTNDPE